MSMVKYFKKLKKNLKGNSGMALVTVIVAIGFVAALVSILLTTTLINFKMKTINDRGKDTFYSAEQVLDEISIGLQRVVSDALSTSYINVLENYGDSDSEEKNSLIQGMYYQEIWNKLSDPANPSTTKYSVSRLNEFLKDSTKWHTYASTSGESGSGDGYGAIVTAVVDGVDGTEGEMYTFSNSGVVLKNVKVYYKDIYGFVSVIQTDIRLNYPGFEFAKNSAIADITSFCFITDSGVKADTTGNLSITGNAYANDFETINVNTTIDGNSLFIVKNDISIKDQSDLSIKFEAKEGTTIWAKNLKSAGADLDIIGSVNLSNDINLSGDRPSVKIKGTLNGYGNSKTDADESSAILINGYKSKVDLRRVDQLNLYGKAFLGMTNAAEAYADQTYNLGVPKVETYKDISTGESIAVKADQLMYLVPAEAIGVSRTTGRSIYNRNPLDKTEYNNLLAMDDVDMISDSTQISSLGGDTLADYVEYTAGGTGAPLVYTHEVPTNDGQSVVYFYMLFGDKTLIDPETGRSQNYSAEQIANRYFSRYMEYNKETAEQYAKVYIDEVTLPRLDRDFDVRAGQSYTAKYIAGAETIEIWPETRADEGERNAEEASKNQGIFKAYTTKLIPSLIDLGGLNKNPQAIDATHPKTDPSTQVVFENVVCTETKLEEYLDRGIAAVAADDDGKFGDILVENKSDASKKELWFTDQSDPGGDSIAIISTGHVNVNDSHVHLVITSGDATVSSDINGVVLCNGELNITGTNNNWVLDPDAVSKCLQYGYEEGTLVHAIASCVEGGNDYVFSSYGDGYSGATSLEGLVSYENWKKE